jgi:(E)-4-hydroxy-3-methylbut-2-enyl-diphosphate synthase
MGIIKSSVGIGSLLCDGIGDTIRVSLTADPAEEVYAAKDILKACGLYSEGVEIISCPTCGRCKIDFNIIANQAQVRLAHIKTPLKVAIMGCVVNGPGEAKEADIGIAEEKTVRFCLKKDKL